MLKFQLGFSSIVLLSLCLKSVHGLNCKAISDEFGIDLDSFKYPISFDTIQEYPPTQNVIQIQFDLCNSLKSDPSLPAQESCPEGTRICLKKTNKLKGHADRLIQVVPIANADGEFHSSTQSDKSTMQMSGGTYNGVKQQADFDLICDQSVSNSDSVPIFESYDDLKGLLRLSWKHKTFCSKGKNQDGGSKSPSGGDEKKDGERESNQGWGFFSWFFFLIFLIFGIYLFTGIYQNHKAGSRGIELLPHRQFWSEVPSMIKDMFSSGIRLGRGGGGRGDYEAL